MNNTTASLAIRHVIDSVVGDILAINCARLIAGLALMLYKT